MEPSLTPEELLRREAGALPVDDILALCYSMQEKQQLERLRFYLDVLRRRGGDRAQFACALICYDLARQGDPAAQREFVFIADSVRALAGNGELVGQLVGGDPYLSYVWDLCRAQLDGMDPRFDEPPAEPEAAPVEVELLSDADFAEDIPDLSIDDVAMRQRFEEALEAFLGGVPGMPVFDVEAGFRLRSGRDVERVESFLRELDSLRDYVRVARGYRALTLLFYGTHMRSRSLFGAANPRKQELLREGLAEFVSSGHIVGDIAGVLSPLHADADVWLKVVDVVQDYVSCCVADPRLAKEGPAGYDAVGRLVARDQGRGRLRRG